MDAVIHDSSRGRFDPSDNGGGIIGAASTSDDAVISAGNETTSQDLLVYRQVSQTSPLTFLAKILANKNIF